MKGGLILKSKNKLNEVSLGNVNNQELKEIKNLENKLDDKYILIAFDKNDVR